MTTICYILITKSDGMEVGLSVQGHSSCRHEQQLVVQVDQNLFDELEDTFIRPENEATDPIYQQRIWIVHFICDLQCDALQILSEGIATYSSYFVEVHISIQCNNNNNNDPAIDEEQHSKRILFHINNLRDCILNQSLSLNVLVFHIDIVADIYDDVYCRLLQIMDEKLYSNFMNMDSRRQSLAFKLGTLEVTAFFK